MASRRFELWAGLAASSLALLAFGALAEAVYSPRWSPVETGIFRAVLADRSPWLDRVMEALTHLGDPLVLLGLALVTALVGWPSRAVADRFAIPLVLLVASAANLLLKTWFGRPRPGLDFHPLTEEPYSSFPSGHSMVSLCLYGFLAWLVLHAPMPRRWRWSLCALLCAVVAVVGLTRIYLAVHYPGDVVGGYAAGLPILWAALALQRRRKTRV